MSVWIPETRELVIKQEEGESDADYRMRYCHEMRAHAYEVTEPFVAVGSFGRTPCHPITKPRAVWR